MQIDHSRTRNLNWREAAPVVYLQAWLMIWTQDNLEQNQQVARVAIKSGITEMRVPHPDHSATLPPVSCSFLKMANTPTNCWYEDFHECFQSMHFIDPLKTWQANTQFPNVLGQITCYNKLLGINQIAPHSSQQY